MNSIKSCLIFIAITASCLLLCSYSSLPNKEHIGKWNGKCPITATDTITITANVYSDGLAYVHLILSQKGTLQLGKCPVEYKIEARISYFGRYKNNINNNLIIEALPDEIEEIQVSNIIVSVKGKRYNHKKITEEIRKTLESTITDSITSIAKEGLSSIALSNINITSINVRFGAPIKRNRESEPYFYDNPEKGKFECVDINSVPHLGLARGVLTTSDQRKIVGLFIRNETLTPYYTMEYSDNKNVAEVCENGITQAEKDYEKKFVQDYHLYAFTPSTGYGRYMFDDGNVYEGSWHNHKPNGNGKMTYSTGEVIEGIWNNGKFDPKSCKMKPAQIFFDLRGPVKTCNNFTFYKNGVLKEENNIVYLNSDWKVISGERGEYEYSRDFYLQYICGAEGGTIINYKSGQLYSVVVGECGDNMDYRYEYENSLVKCVNVYYYSSFDENKCTWQGKYTYEYLQFDDNGNWVKRNKITRMADGSRDVQLETRRITYYELGENDGYELVTNYQYALNNSKNPDGMDWMNGRWVFDCPPVDFFIVEIRDGYFRCSQDKERIKYTKFSPICLSKNISTVSHTASLYACYEEKCVYLDNKAMEKVSSTPFKIPQNFNRVKKAGWYDGIWKIDGTYCVIRNGYYLLFYPEWSTDSLFWHDTDKPTSDVMKLIHYDGYHSIVVNLTTKQICVPAITEHGFHE